MHEMTSSARSRRTSPLERAPWAEPVADVDGEPEVPIGALSPYFGPRNTGSRYSSYTEDAKPVKYPKGKKDFVSYRRPMPFVLGLSGEDPMTATITN